MINEIVTLFGAYGVTVDYRHLYLIGDYMTFSGNIKAMNRNWMSYSASPFLRMSYETSVKFITNAALHCEIDTCKSPSSSIILGQAPKLGTGMCDLLMDTGLWFILNLYMATSIVIKYALNIAHYLCRQ